MTKKDLDCNGDKTGACLWVSLDTGCGRQGQGLCLNAEELRTELLATLCGTGVGGWCFGWSWNITRPCSLSDQSHSGSRHREVCGKVPKAEWSPGSRMDA